jgi:hypothetical protein
VAALASGRPPAMLESPVSTRFEMAFYAADRACRGDLSFPRFAKIFGDDARVVFGRELAFLAHEGVLRIQGEHVSKPPSRAFQVTHLLAFLLKNEGELARDLERLDQSASPPEPLDVVAQYEAVRAELPPSLLWCRIAMRAAQATRKVQRLAVAGR